MPEIALCRNCEIRVAPSPQGECPSCGKDVNAAPVVERKQVSTEEEETLLRKYQTLLLTRRCLGIGIALDLFNTVVSSLRANADTAAGLTGGIIVACVLAIAIVYVSHKAKKLRTKIDSVTSIN